MFLRKNNQSKQQKIIIRWQQVVVATLLLIGLSTSTGYLKVEASEGLMTIYHIYSGEEYIGELSDEAKLEQLAEDKLDKVALEFNDLQLIAGDDLSVIPERVFTAGTEDEIILEKMKSELIVEAEAVAIMVDGEPVLYVKDMATYDDVVKNLKLQEVTEQELINLESRESSTTPLPPLGENGTRIIKLLLDKDLQARTEKVLPDEVLTFEEAVAFFNKGKIEESQYSVEYGDALGSIAIKHGMTTAELLERNPNITAETVLKPGMELSVTIEAPIVEIEAHYESKGTESIPYKKITKEDASLFKGDRKVINKGVEGEKEVTEFIRKQGGQVIGKSTEDEKVIVEPKDEVAIVGTKVIPSRGIGTFMWPAKGGYVSSQMGERWGRNHNGIDIARPSSRTIVAADNGVVTSAGSHSTYGNKVEIDHNNGYKTLYAHLSSIDVKVGQVVPQGTKIGIMGSTGRSTGIHLHFEVTKNDALVNPMSVLDK